MAATVQWNGAGVPLFRQVDVTFGSSDYTTGGYSISASQLGLTKVLGVIVMSNPSGYVFEFNTATSKLLAYRVNTTSAALSEVPAATNLNGLTVHLLAVGQ